MCYRQHRESEAQPSACTAPAKCQTVGFEARSQYDRPSDEQKEQAGQSLRGLRELICELLIRNQELRMLLLDSATNCRSREADQ